MKTVTNLPVIVVFIFVTISTLIFMTINRTKVLTNKDEAIKLLKQKIDETKMSSYWATNPCVFYISDEVDKNTFQIGLHEKHTKECPGDPNTSPLLVQFRIDKKTGVITKYDIINDRYIGWEDFTSKL